MRIRSSLARSTLLAGLITGLTTLGFAGSALAHEGEYAQFNNCPSTNGEVFKCIHSVTEGGKVILGKKSVPIVNPVTLQGGFGVANGEKISKFFAATNGVTLSKTPQPVPGGLLGIVPPENSPWLVKQLSKFFFENGLTGVNSTLELAKPASEIQISERNLISKKEVALKLPVRVRLENPFLGSSCYVGSSSSPLIWNLTTGTTAPPSPNEPISGAPGTISFTAEGRILNLSGNKMVDNAWSAPTASGCGGILSFLVDPIINAELGLASAGGKNTAILENTIAIATAEAVNNH